MPIRKVPLATGEIYHVLNRTVGGIPLFREVRNYRFFLDILRYYQRECSLRFSYFRRFSQEERASYLEAQKAQPALVQVLAYCLMPNHFHLLVKQVADRGIHLWMRKALNSYSSSFNPAAQRYGPLFQGPFRAVRVSTDEQLLHVSRYIHINPYVGLVIKRRELVTYSWSSLAVYLGKRRDEFVDQSTVMEHFSNAKAYEKFVHQEADYQRKLKEFSFLWLEKPGM